MIGETVGTLQSSPSVLGSYHAYEQFCVQHYTIVMEFFLAESSLAPPYQVKGRKQSLPVQLENIGFCYPARTRC